jgi:hypothetical protein
MLCAGRTSENPAHNERKLPLFLSDNSPRGAPQRGMALGATQSGSARPPGLPASGVAAGPLADVHRRRHEQAQEPVKLRG